MEIHSLVKKTYSCCFPASFSMFIQLLIIGISTCVNAYPWINLKENGVDKLSTGLQYQDNNDLSNELNSLIEKLYSNRLSTLEEENKLWSENNDTPNIYDSDKTSHALAELLTYNPLPECQEKYLINMKQFISCIKEIQGNIHSGVLSKRRDGLMKLNPTGWKRKRRDTATSLALDQRSQNEYRLNQLINHLLMQKREKMRFNPTGW
ncbi:uncharacterized protein LOC134709474 [Mytilus trossulus]|uniref:uncharacterized protein LOC134709474 n=1 Tax=Mytilus trossulus TaxID=6551 RepID=UPI003003B312